MLHRTCARPPSPPPGRSPGDRRAGRRPGLLRSPAALRTGAAARHAAFTLIELVMVVALAATLLTLGIPALRDMVRNNRLVAATNDLVVHLNVARSEAITRRSRVGLCSSTAPLATVPSCDGAGNWDAGRVLFVDPDADGAPNAAAEVLRVHTALPGETRLRSNLGTVIYAPDGSLVGATAPSFGVCDSRGEVRGRQVSVNLVGRAQVNAPATACTP